MSAARKCKLRRVVGRILLHRRTVGCRLPLHVGNGSSPFESELEVAAAPSRGGSMRIDRLAGLSLSTLQPEGVKLGYR